MRFTSVVLISCIGLWASATTQLPVQFEPNRGQFAEEVLYAARGRGSTLAVCRDSIWLNRVVRLDFPGGHRQSNWVPLELAAGVTDYRIGRDPKRWISGVPHYLRLRRGGLYRGVDVELYGAEERFEYDFVLIPGTSPRNLRMRFQGADSLAIDTEGNLIISSAAGTLIQRRPHSYQRTSAGRRAVETRYRLFGGQEVGIEAAKYDPSATLIVDPVIESFTLLGGSADDRVFTSGPGYVVGTTSSPDFPGVVNAFHRGSDVFIYSPSDGNTLIIGGSGDDVVTSVSGDLIGGYTNSTDLPTSPSPTLDRYGAAQTSYGGGASDGFFILLRGSNVAVVSYVGGSGDDRVLAVGYSGTFAVAGTTNSPDLPLLYAWQPAPSNGFVAVYDWSGNLVQSTYIGGSDGADRPMALLPHSQTDFYVAGEVRSTDWAPVPGWMGSRQGGSDGFVIHARASASGAPFAITEALLLGGGGEDSVAALAARPDGPLAAAGTTSSAELASYHGGASDAFVATLSPDLLGQGGLVLIGGSGAEQATSIAVNKFREVAVGGWTTSHDLLIRDAVQPLYGGGRDDGFLYYADSTGRPIFSTYLGGNGSDRIDSVQFDEAQRIYAGGSSTSTDLPLKNSPQPNAGGWDGFQVVMKTPILHADDLQVGKDLSGIASVQLGDPVTATGVPLTVTSGDASRVMLALRPDDPGAASVTIAYRTGTDIASRSFRASCLTDAGTVPLTLSAPGYGNRSIDVSCVPSAVYVTPVDVQLRLGQYSGPARLAVFPAAIDPDSGRALLAQAPRAGTPELRVDAAVSEPSLLHLQSTSLSFDSFSAFDGSAPPGFLLSGLGKGTAEVVLSASSGWRMAPSGTVRVRVTGPSIALRVPPVSRDVVSAVAYGPNPNLESGSMSVTLTSSDPAKVRLTTSLSESGTESVTGTCSASTACTPIYLEVLDASEPVSITASSPDINPVVAPVRFTPPAAAFYRPGNYYSQETGFSMMTGRTRNSVARIGTPPRAPYDTESLARLRSGAAPVEVRVVSSDPAVILPDNPAALWSPGGYFNWPVVLSAKSAGTATLTLQSNQAGLLAVPLTVRVRDEQVTLQDATVGKDLQALIQLSRSDPDDSQPIAATVTSSDPSRVLLSLDPSTSGAASVTVQMYNWPVIYAQALADRGDVEITTTTAGFPAGESTVHLAPSGFAWTSSRLTLTSAITGPSMSAYALDPANLTPLAPQLVRPGLAGEIRIGNSNPNAATLESANLPLSGFTAPNISQAVRMETALGGETLLTLVQPNGFTAPAGRGPIRVNVPRAALQLTVPSLGRNLQSSGSVGTSGKLDAAQITVASADPSKLIISTNDSDGGGGSVTVRRRADGSYPPLFFQALDGPADVAVTASADGFDPVTQAVRIFPTTLVFSAYPGAVVDPQVTTTTVQDTVNLTVYALALEDGVPLSAGYGFNNLVLRPGLGPIAVQVQSSNPAVAAVQNNPIPLNSLTNSSLVRVKPLSGGETRLSIIYPPGFVPPPPGFGKTARVIVEGPAFVIPSVTVGKDLQVAVKLALANNGAVVPTDVDVTLTSSDASRLLLSATGDAGGSESVTVHFAANAAASRTVFLQALVSGETATVAITAPGYGSSQAVIRFNPSTLTPAVSSITLTPGGPVTRLRFTPRPIGYYGPETFRFRPELPPFEVSASTSNSAVLALPTSKLSVSGGAEEVLVEVQPAGVGTAVVSLESPNLATSQGMSVSVQGGVLSLINPGLIAKDLQEAVTLFTQGPPAEITVTSADPARLLLSASPIAPGQASVVLNATADQSPRVYAHALASSGNVEITATAPGFVKATQAIGLAEPTLFMAPRSTLSTLTTLSSPVVFNVSLGVRSGSPSRPQALRPGVPSIATTIRTTSPAVGSLTPSELVFDAGELTKTFSFQPLAPGSTLLSASVPPGLADSLSQRQQLLTILAPQLAFNATLSIGKDLVKTIGASIVGGTASPIVVRLTSLDAGRLLLSTPANPAPADSVEVAFSGTNTSNFSLVGLASNGNAQIDVAGPGVPAVTYDVALRPSGFRISYAPSSAPPGSVGTISVVPCALIPVSMAPDGDAALRPGVIPIPVSLISSDSSVATGSTLVFQSGDASRNLGFAAKAAGSVTFTLTLPEGYSLPSIGGTATMTIR